MAQSRKCFTCIWKITNFSFSSLGKIDSPYFFVSTIDGVEYRLHLFIDRYLKGIYCAFSRSCSDTDPEQPELDCELAFLSCDGNVLKSKIFLSKYIQRLTTFSQSLYVSKNDVFYLQKDDYIPDDTFTIRCRLWKSDESISHVGKCIVLTRTEIHCRRFIGTIGNFCRLVPGVKYPVKIANQLPSSEISSLNLYSSLDRILNIEIDSEIAHFTCKIFVLDKYKNKVKCGQNTRTRFHSGMCSIPLIFSKDYLMKNKEYFLPNYELTIHFEMIFPIKESVEKNIDEIEYIFDSEDSQGDTDEPSEEHHIENLSTLKDDWNSLFKEGILCDAKLKTATETFPVHTVVLSARSPVFKSMFTNDMKEKTNHYVDIDDLDADTVRRMLLFMYSDGLNNLEYESAKSLYFAADKYNIVSLRQRCSNFLKQNILHSNCVDILLLADKHQDKDLKNSVQNFISKNDEVILNSDEWKDLEENHSRLTTEVFRFIYMKNRRN